MRARVLAISTIVGAVICAPAPRAQQPSTQPDVDTALKPTHHPRLPSDLSHFWMAPSAHSARAATASAFATAVKLEVESDFAKALPLFAEHALQQGTLGDYGIYYEGLAQLRLGHAAEARRTFASLGAKLPVGYLSEAAALREAESDESLNDQSAALKIYERLSNEKTTAPDDVLMRLAHAAKLAGDKEKAALAYSRVLYEFPFSDSASIAATELESLPVAPIVPGTARYKLELGRAERLFGAKRYSVARPVFETLRHSTGATQADSDTRELVNLRLAECDYFLKRARAARDALRPYLEKSSRQGEALYFYAVATRELGDHDTYYKMIRRLADEFKDQSWGEEALNNLATHYILEDDDEHADAVFHEMYEKFPAGHYAERAAWKLGWYAYRNHHYADAVRAFESGAARFPRSDYRPAWLYWSARAHESLNEHALAESRFKLVTTDYLNSYYGRLAVARMPAAGLARSVPDPPDAPRPIMASAVPVAVAPSEEHALPPLPPNEQVIRALLGLELYDQAVDELKYAQRVWGDSPPIQATLGWIYNARGDLRAGINAVKRAYPQYLAEGGERMPAEVLKILFPVSYWPLIQRYAAEHSLDPYVMAALVAQESNFEADVRSPANAYGLMQLLPATGRYYARTLHLPRKFSISMLTTADSNLRMGMAYFADLVHQFGGVHYALATYNAGPNRVARWIAARPGFERDEFVDDIPFPETQNYVKKILGTAEDYRHLYGPGSPGFVAAPGNNGDNGNNGNDDNAATKSTAPPAAVPASATMTATRAAARHASHRTTKKRATARKARSSHHASAPMI